MSRTPEQFDEIADAVAAVRGDFLVKGDFADSDVAAMNAEVAKILADNNITSEEFDAGLEARVFPPEPCGCDELDYRDCEHDLTNSENLVD